MSHSSYFLRRFTFNVSLQLYYITYSQKCKYKKSGIFFQPLEIPTDLNLRNSNHEQKQVTNLLSTLITLYHIFNFYANSPILIFSHIQKYSILLSKTIFYVVKSNRPKMQKQRNFVTPMQRCNNDATMIVYPFCPVITRKNRL